MSVVLYLLVLDPVAFRICSVRVITRPNLADKIIIMFYMNEKGGTKLSLGTTTMRKL